MGSSLFAKIVFPTHLLEEEVLGEWRDKYVASEFEHVPGITELSSSEVSNGEFKKFESWLIENSIPFDRYSEGDVEDPPVIRYFRPDPYFLEEVVTDQNWNGIVSAEVLYDHMARYVASRITTNDLLILISELIQDSDPVLTKKINPITHYREEV